jgi:superfamily II DNA or RNA helicase
MNCAIEYKEWQFEPWNRIIERLPFPRILIADDVGLGKTTEAAIILAELTRRRRADRVLIVAPQHLCEKWQDELFNRFGLAFEIYNRATRE